nr:YceK/YidQ family lipoprotein [Serratia marcescens]
MRCSLAKQPPLLRVNVVNLSSYLRLACVAAGVMALTGCGSIISRTVPGAGHGHQYYPGVQWDLRDTPWRYVTVIDVPLSMVVDTFMLPFDAQHGPYE